MASLRLGSPELPEATANFDETSMQLVQGERASAEEDRDVSPSGSVAHDAQILGQVEFDKRAIQLDPKVCLRTRGSWPKRPGGSERRQLHVHPRWASPAARGTDRALGPDPVEILVARVVPHAGPPHRGIVPERVARRNPKFADKPGHCYQALPPVVHPPTGWEAALGNAVWSKVMEFRLASCSDL